MVEFCEYMGHYPHTAVRALEPSDLPALLDIYAHYVLHSSYTFEYEPPSLESFTSRCLAYSARHPFLVLLYQNQLAGYAYACQFRDRTAYKFTAETSIYLHPRVCGLGLSAGLYSRLIQQLKEMGHASAIGVITLPNEPSMTLHRNLGFEWKGQITHAGFKHGKWHDIALMQKML